MEKIEVTMTVEKETPGTIKFLEDEMPGQPPLLRNIYIAKFRGKGVRKIKVTVEEVA